LNENYLGEPIWYYPACLTWVPQPWSIAAFAGLALSFKSAFREGSKADRFIWCWALMPILVFSLAQGKHHHYMLHYLAPWAILAAQGTVWAWQKLALRWSLRRPALSIVTGFACLFMLYCVGFAYKGAFKNRSRHDTEFLFAARQAVPADQPLMINSAEEALEGLRMQFYIGDSVYFLHNLSFVLDDRVHASNVYVVTRYDRLAQLQKYGAVEPLLKSEKVRRETKDGDKWTLFRLHLREDLPRRSVHVPISPMQAMYREEGPMLD
jgi:hypothetical protein